MIIEPGAPAFGAEPVLLALGATLLQDATGRRFYADPAGHHVCLLPARP
ncbi:hypothetical protein [Kitasatospora sp. NPDC057541]